MSHVELLAGKDLQGRRAGTPFERRAIEYLAKQLDDANIHALDIGGEVEGSGEGSGDRGRMQRLQTFTFQEGPFQRQSANVIGVILPEVKETRKSKEWPSASRRWQDVLVVGAHLDHLGQVNGKLHPGADDNASGVAIILEVSKRLQQAVSQRDLPVRPSLQRPVVIVFFGAEERGLIGSRAFVNAGPLKREQMTAMINIDMIGRPLMDQRQLATAKRFVGFDSAAGIGVIGADDQRPLFQKAVDNACRSAKIVPYGTQPLLAPILGQLSRNRSDHSPFEDAGIPALFLSSGESDDYHSPRDTIQTVDGKLLARRATMVYELVRTLAEAPREKFPATKPAPSPAEEGSR